ncbi:hypothetical protein [Kineosporia sp. NBRC 101731]|uniref:hypothetical protein n=1 Tax=Kineosporia sp. NBRC 101731 TaxID=3032199 RepID=UPI0024A5539D|nr:hypothetical protein [Kineosporia sp. NBRC 101731]GLY33349.1 hypothetical protein Kisp02_67140 [Kineosporia sp. NBRC 101731]
MTAIAAIALGVTLIRRDVPRSLLLVVVCFVVAGFLLWLCLFIIRRGRGALVLTPSGVYHRTGLTDQFTPWDTITDVRARNGPAPSFVIEFALTADLRARSSLGRLGDDVRTLPRIVCPAATFRSQTVPAYRTVRYYFENPDRRHKIGR